MPLFRERITTLSPSEMFRVVNQPLSEDALRRLKTALHLDVADREAFYARGIDQQDQGTLRDFLARIDVPAPVPLRPHLDRRFRLSAPGRVVLIEEV